MKKIGLYFLFIVQFAFLYGQNGFVRTFRQEKAAFWILKSFEIPEKGFLLSGMFQTTALSPVNHSRNIRLDYSGNVIWDKEFHWGVDDIKYSSAMDKEGNIIDCGFWDRSWEEKFSQGFAGKYSFDGDSIWERHYGGVDTDNWKKVIVSSSGDIYALGYAVTDSMFSQVSLTKLNQSGDSIWSRYIGGPFFDSPGNIIELPNGRILISGITSKNDSILESKITYLCWLSSMGEILDYKEYPQLFIYQRTPTINRLQIINDSTLFVSGIWMNPLIMDMNGTIIKEFTNIPLYAPGIPTGLLCILSDYSYLTTKPRYKGEGNYAIIIQKYDEDENLIMEKEIDLFFDQFFEDIFETSNGGFACYGYKTESNSSTPEGLFLLTDCEGNIEFSGNCPKVYTYRFGEFRLFPNPAQDYFILDPPDDLGETDFQIGIYNSIGQLCGIQEGEQKGGTRIDCSHFAPGVYLVNVSTGQNRLWQSKIVIKP